jgi:hypothetical protein
MTVFNIGKTASGRAIGITARFAARHGLIAGATGTGKSYTIARLVEQMTGQGIPVFLVDVKGTCPALPGRHPASSLHRLASRARSFQFAPMIWARIQWPAPCN